MSNSRAAAQRALWRSITELETEGSACPEPELVAAFAEGALDPGTHDELIEHLGACSRCASAVALVAEERGSEILERAVPGAGSRTSRSKARTRLYVLCGLAAAAAALGLLLWRPWTSEPERAADLRDALVREARRLESAGLTRTSELEPLSEIDLARGGAAVQRASAEPAVLAPRGSTPSRAPRFVVLAPAGTSALDLRVLDASGTELARVERVLAVGAEQRVAIELPASARLEPSSTYVVEATLSGIRGELSITALFTTSSALEERSWSALVAELERIADPAVRFALLAQAAHRRGFHGEAEQAAERALEAAPGDPYLLALAAVLRVVR